MLSKKSPDNWNCCVRMTESDEVAVLGEMIHHGKYHRFALPFGKSSTKSMAISAQTDLGISSGCSSPAGWRCSDLLHCHMLHPLMKSRTWQVAWGWKKESWSRCSVFCAVVRIYGQNTEEEGTKMHPLCSTRPLTTDQSGDAKPCSICCRILMMSGCWAASLWKSSKSWNIGVESRCMAVWSSSWRDERCEFLPLQRMGFAKLASGPHFIDSDEPTSQRLSGNYKLGDNLCSGKNTNFSRQSIHHGICFARFKFNAEIIAEELAHPHMLWYGR